MTASKSPLCGRLSPSADERTRTSTGFPPHGPEPCASTNSATSARIEIVASPPALVRQRLEHQLGVRVRLHAPHHLGDAALAVDEEGGALNTHVGLAIVGPLHPRAVLLGDFVLWVGEEREGQPILLLELHVRRLAVGADAED